MEILIVGDPWQLLDGLAIDLELIGVEVDAWEFVVVGVGLEVNLVLAFPKAAHFVHAGAVLLE